MNNRETSDDGPSVWYLHGNAEVHHGHAGVAMPADVHGGVATVTLALQGRARAAELLLRLLLSSSVLQQLWGTTAGGWLAEKDRGPSSSSSFQSYRHTDPFMGL